VSNARILLIGGSETSATLLSGLIFHLLQTPQVLENLQREIRQAFTSPSEMTFSAETKLPYMQACIEEALRIYPPLAGTLPRWTPPSGATIDGLFIPGNVRSFTDFNSHESARLTSLDMGWCPSH
jgi:cytochrome P450